MKRFKKQSILRQIRILAIRHTIVPVIIITVAFIFLREINFDSAFKPTLYQNSFDAYSAYTNGEDNVVIHINELKYTGYNILKGNKIKSVYYYDLSSERCMFYKLDMSFDSVEDIPKILTDYTVSARFVKMDGITKNMMESFAHSINWTFDGLNAITFPVQLDEHEYNLNIYYISYVLILIAIFYSLWLLAENIILLIAPFLHLAYIRIKPYFPSMSYFEMIDAINKNFEEQLLVTAGRMYITDKYFINLGPHEVSIIPLDQIILAYNHGQLFSLLGIHIKMSHTLHLRGYHNIKILASHKKATHITIITDYLRENYPSIIWGHTKENIIAYQQILATVKANETSGINTQ